MPLVIAAVALALLTGGFLVARRFVTRRRRAAELRAFEAGRRGGAAVAALLGARAVDEAGIDSR
jgi:hypothetical protein